MTIPSNNLGLVAIDTGGTFTDFYWISQRGVRTHKVLSTPRDPSRAIKQGLRDLGCNAAIIHGSTVATNALLEHKGARIALVTTADFEDVIEIGRQQRTELYQIDVERVAPLVARRYRFGVRERMTSDGKVLIPLTQKELSRLRRQLKKHKFDAIAICTLNSFANPRHERAIGQALADMPAPLSLSSEICPEYREFERSSTTCTNAYVTPIMSRYLQKLSGTLKQPIRVMQSNGGSLSVREASREAVRTLLSGPAGGALGALRAARASGFNRLLALDMGGTSTDCTLIDEKITLTSEAVVGGYPVKSPMIDIHTIGAGGGSIARLDAGGALQVGPESAGATPGPICYGSGGRELTITDAHLCLGRLHPDYFLGGHMTLQPKKIVAPLRRLAKRARLSGNETAAGIIAVANAHMARALRVISLERGHDPRQFTLLAFGGAGGLHAAELAAALEIPRVLVPANPGILSAYGMAHADWARDYVQSLLWKENRLSPTRLMQAFARLKKRAEQAARREGFDIKELRFVQELDVRYQGQSYELRIPDHPDIRRHFERAHRQSFGYVHKDRPIEVVNVRLQVRAPQHRVRQRQHRGRAARRYRPETLQKERLYWNQRSYPMALYERDSLETGAQIKGPALIVEFSGTTFVPPNWQAMCDSIHNLILTAP